MSDALRLFTVFHGNLDFSALPEADVPCVLERCYWPLLRLAEADGLPLGIEMPARTLARIAREDPEWVEALRRLVEAGRVELVGSGLAQLAGPLVPADVNRANLALGRRAYAALLGAAPETWFVHEQTLSHGLAPLYAEVGAARLVVEWNNPASHRPELRPLRHRPARLDLALGGGPPGAALPLLWNDSVVFQKLQRAAHGLVPIAEYRDFVLGAARPDGPRLVAAYGGDLEIFDYRPGHPAPPGAERGEEMARLRAALCELAARPGCRFVLPREAAAGLDAGPLVALASAEDPLPCKKQPRYNPTRWAVSGRDGLGANTRCERLRRELGAAGLLGDPHAPDAEALVALWRSDLRTRATEEKLADFQEGAARLASRARDALEARAPKLDEGADAVLANPWPEPWPGEIVEVTVRLPAGRLAAGRVVAEPASALPPTAVQLEVVDRHRDGSVRRARIVAAPRLGPGERVALRVVPAPPALPPPASEAGVDGLRTPSVEARLLPHRGGALRALRFPEIAPAPLVGTIPHGSFDHVALACDWYSGHGVLVTEQGAKVTDLQPVQRVEVEPPGPLRRVVHLHVPTALGTWTRTLRAYCDRPRLDVVQSVHLREVRLRSLRVGTVTWLPEAFARDRLAYATVNGGDAVEHWPLPPGACLEQGEPASPAVSARSCLGATEGWIAAGDDRAGVGVVCDRSRAALVPLLEFRDAEGRFLLRVHHTAAETDETRATFFRGVQRFALALVGYAGSLEPVRRTARAIGRGLLYRTETHVGIASGL